MKLSEKQKIWKVAKNSKKVTMLFLKSNGSDSDYFLGGSSGSGNNYFFGGK